MPNVFHILVVILVAILAWWLVVDLAHLPVVVGAVAAILVLVGGFGGWGGRGGYWTRGPR